MQWFIDLMELIDKWTGVGENYSFIIAGVITCGAASLIVMPIMNLFRK